MDDLELVAKIAALTREVERLKNRDGEPRWHYLQSPYTSTSWDGDAKTGASGTLDLSAVFGVPASVKAISARIEISATGSGVFGGIGPNNTNLQVGQTSQVANVKISNTGVTACDANGDVYFYQNGALATVKIEIYGYYK